MEGRYKPVCAREYWIVNHSGITDYFFEFLPLDEKDAIKSKSPPIESRQIINWLTTTNSPLIIDLFAPTDALHLLFSSYLKKRRPTGISVSRDDERSMEDYQSDLMLGITHIVGDLGLSDTWYSLSQAIPKPASLIMERGLGALNCVPQNADYFQETLNRILSILDNPGIAILQTKSYEDLKRLNIDMYQFLTSLEQMAIRYRYIPTYSSKRVADMNFGLLMLQKGIII